MKLIVIDARPDELAALRECVAERLPGLEITTGMPPEAEEEGKFRLLFHSSRDAVLVHELTSDLSPGRIVEANAEACRRYGFSRAELLDKPPLELVAPEGRGAWLAALQRLESAAQTKWEGTHVTRDGGRIPVEIVGVRIFHGGRAMVMATVHDVAERKQITDALARQLDELRRWQTVTLGREGRIGELKQEVNLLAARLGETPPYATPEELESQAKQ